MAACEAGPGAGRGSSSSLWSRPNEPGLCFWLLPVSAYTWLVSGGCGQPAEHPPATGGGVSAPTPGHTAPNPTPTPRPLHDHSTTTVQSWLSRHAHHVGMTLGQSDQQPTPAPVS